MVLFCCVVNCGSRAQRDPVKFFRIPAELHYKHRTDLNELSRLRRQKWLNVIKRADLDETKIKYSFVCSKHFIEGKPSDLTDSLNPDWIPTLNMGYDLVSQTSAALRLNRYKRKCLKEMTLAEPSTSKMNTDTEHHETAPTEDIDAGISIQVNDNNKFTQTDMTSMEILDINIALRNAIKAREQLEKRIISCENLRNDDFNLKYYTGLTSYTHFETVIGICEPYIRTTQNTLLPAKEQILLSLMKLRLNLDIKDLAFRFGISPKTASLYFKNVVNVMWLRMSNFIFWPSRDIIKKTLPQCFKEAFHDNTTVIIDCFEIRTQKPSDMLTMAQSWSHYKHSQTIKYLIGITPQGFICFVSEGWGGRVSDKCITENSTFLQNLHPGDTVMADRGFLIKEFVELFGANVKIPAFTRGKTQLHPIDLEKTRAIAHCRIHVERVIGLLRQKFTILNDVVPIVLLSTGGNEPIFDKIVYVACCLINLCPSIVPM